MAHDAIRHQEQYVRINAPYTQHMLAFINAGDVSHSVLSEPPHSQGLVGSVINCPLIHSCLSFSELLVCFFGPKIQTNEKTSAAPDKLPVSGRSDEPSGRPDRTSSGGGACVCVVYYS